MAGMASAKDDAAAMLREYAELLSITGGDPFRARNYEKAAKVVAGYPGDLGAVPDKALTKIPGVGTSIAGKIAEYRRTGTVAALDELRAKVPPGVLQIAKVPGVGPKRALQLSRDGRYLLAVDAGSNQISVLRVGWDGSLQLVPGGVVSSGGLTPVSIAVHGSLVYVANSGAGGSNFTGSMSGIWCRCKSLPSTPARWDW